VKFKRVLLKLSGEQFAGGQNAGIDSDFVNRLARDVKRLRASGLEVVVVVGGGNFVRGKDIKVKGLNEETAHYMGMISTMLNGLVLADVLRAIGQPAHVQSRLGAVAKVADKFEPSKAEKHLKKGEIVIILGGTGKPFVTTDTGAVQAAAALKCQVVLKATKVDGVYDKDPMKHRDAKKIDSLTHQEASAHPDIKVMDNEAHEQAEEHGLPIIVFELSSENLIKVARGQAVGSKVTA
jgi:uridylate kinase